MKRDAIFQELKEIAAAHQWKLLSPMYTRDSTKVHLRCKKGHEWFTRASNIRHRKYGCPSCNYESKGLPQEEKEKRLKQLRVAAKEKRGACLSREYVNAKTKVKMRCEFGHEWKALPPAILNTGSWCHRCSSKASINEAICRLYFQQLFDKEFPPAKPKWLLNETGHRLELDGYCEELKLAFEYNGKQHYEAVPYFGGEERFRATQIRDQRKRNVCKEMGVTLIEIPFSKEGNPKEFILSECDRLGIVVPNRDKECEIASEALYDRMGHLIAKSRQWGKDHPEKDLSNLQTVDFMAILEKKFNSQNNPENEVKV